MAKKPSNTDRRAAAREKARQIAEAQARKQKTAKRVLYIGVALVAALVLVVVGVLIYQSTRPADQPQGYSDGSVTFVKDGDGVALTEDPAGDSKDAKDNAPNVKVFLDYQCPACAQFEGLNGKGLGKLADDGDISLTFQPVALLDNQSGGTKYSTRSANLMMCVVDSGQADKFQELSLSLFSNQPEEGGTGLDDQKMLDLAKEAGVDVDKKINTAEDDVTVKDCVNNIQFEDYVTQSTKEALNGGLKGTPTVQVNGENVGDWSDQQSFFAEILQAQKK